MRRLRSHLIGVDQGELLLFSDFDSGGVMWTGAGPREARADIVFSEPFREVPAVTVWPAMLDVSHATNFRTDLSASEVTREGFAAIFRTWGDTRVARVRLAWQAVGEVGDHDDWVVG